MATAAVITLTEQERKELVSWVRCGKTQRRLAERARMVLEASEGKTNKEIAENLGTRPSRVSKWRTRFARHRKEGLKDAPRTGRPPRYDKNTERRILKVLDEDPPEGYAT